MRIATWNLAGRWTPQHETFVLDLDCDVLLFTEVSERVSVPGHTLHIGEAVMAPRRRWAGIASRRQLSPLDDPHAASAMAVVDDWTVCSSILPWRGAGRREPWQGTRHAEWTEACVAALLARMPTDGLVWGGDWNHALTGREWAGSIGGRASIQSALEKLNLVVPTAELPHRIDGLLSIDHIAVPSDAHVIDASATAAAVDGRWLSDHDAYVVELG